MEKDIYGPAGSREASVNWFKATQAKTLLSNQRQELLNAGGLYEDWFHGIITRKESERLLEHREVGCFLIRLGESRLGYSLSFREESRCRHYMIDYIQQENMYHVLGEPNKHNSLNQLVQYYQENQLQNWSGLLTKPCPQEEGQCDYMELVITPEEEKTLDDLWSKPRLEASAPMYEGKESPAGGQYGIALTQHTTANPASVTSALDQLMRRHRAQLQEDDDQRYSAEPLRVPPPCPGRPGAPTHQRNTWACETQTETENVLQKTRRDQSTSSLTGLITGVNRLFGLPEPSNDIESSYYSSISDTMQDNPGEQSENNKQTTTSRNKENGKYFDGKRSSQSSISSRMSTSSTRSNSSISSIDTSVSRDINVNNRIGELENNNNDKKSNEAISRISSSDNMTAQSPKLPPRSHHKRKTAAMIPA